MSMFNSFAPIDIIVFAVIAGVVIYRLYRQLGSNVELDDSEGTSMDAFEEHDPPKRPSSPQQTHPLFSPDDTEDDTDQEETDDRFAALRELDETFDEKSFIEGASIAFEIISSALNAGDTKTLKPLLSAEMFDEFCAEIKRRRQEGFQYEVELISIDNMAIQAVKLEKDIATLVVEIESEQVYAVYDENRNLVDGQTDEQENLTDIWHFQRNMRSSNPNWLLVYTEEGEDADDGTA